MKLWNLASAFVAISVGATLAFIAYGMTRPKRPEGQQP